MYRLFLNIVNIAYGALHQGSKKDGTAVFSEPVRTVICSYSLVIDFVDIVYFI